MPHIESPLRVSAARCGLLIVDLQEKLVPVIPAGEAVVKQTRRLIEAAKRLEVPFAATVQYPKGLGQLVPRIGELTEVPEEKLAFSSAVCRKAIDRWANQARDQIVVCGIEAHVCVLQTVFDLIAEGFYVFVVADAIASRGELDEKIAIERMTMAGATVISAESLLFEWLGSAEHPEFKAISRMIKDF
ncbi:Vibriobactin-specific isochorismatase [Novipirellula aureliae]|uniref:Vibriobactin-specific isochorismatase n=1 Tax=Novipirellula aureliae TaxID=2527966 RepID=A0A5C6DMC3_9BACT|nr:isochorismatase family protein [Novipirellula aureliae]TWU37782.1 Vibriobactin-specific isochorismatase [Novipirellula aureliae]